MTFLSRYLLTFLKSSFATLSRRRKRRTNTSSENWPQCLAKLKSWARIFLFLSMFRRCRTFLLWIHTQTRVFTSFHRSIYANNRLLVRLCISVAKAFLTRKSKDCNVLRIFCCHYKSDLFLLLSYCLYKMSYLKCNILYDKVRFILILWVNCEIKTWLWRAICRLGPPH